MSLALVGTVCTSYPSWNVLSSTPFPSPFFLRRTWWDGVKEAVYKESESHETNRLTEVYLEGWPLSWCIM